MEIACYDNKNPEEQLGYEATGDCALSKASDVTGLVEVLVGWLVTFLKSQPVGVFFWLATGWLQKILLNRLTTLTN